MTPTSTPPAADATFTPPGSRATPAILALYVKVGACLLAVGADVGRITTARGLGRGEQQVDDLLGADRLVTLAALVELATLVVALVLVARWVVVVRGNRPALGDDQRPAPAALRALWPVLALAVVAVVVTWTALGEAEDVGDRERIDALRAGATLLSAVAAGLAIAAVSALTRRQEERAATVGAPRAAAPERPADEGSAGGLRVVSEEQAQRREMDA